ncbi:MAG: cation diffusion facilitator family transporter [Desulforhabdus sp.]|jgi:cation diffusion facilitator family transporter|nr:cation diffusion facilitator family transporter [Desulforhabdus sp.]
MKIAEDQAFRTRLIAIGCSLLVGTVLMALKFYVYSITNSSAILSDALESIINVVASAFALGSIILAAKPPDPTHPYGHGKIEYFSAGFEGALIVFAAAGIVWTAVPQILSPHELPHLQSGLLILLATSAANLVLGICLVRVGKTTHSLILTADGKHVLTDVYTSAGVLAGLYMVHLTDWYWLDGAIALLVALNILIIGFKLIRASFAGLMDASDPELVREISELLTRQRKSTWIDIHRLRAIRSGIRIHLDFHMILPRDLTLEEAHNEVMQLQQVINHYLNGKADILIHAEPCIDPECPVCGYDRCGIRQEPTRHQPLWHPDVLIAESAEDTELDSRRTSAADKEE